MEKVKPIILTDVETGTKYTLEFNREAVKFAESKGFKLDPKDLASMPMTTITDLFWYAFRMHHKSVSHEKSDSFIDMLGGVTTEQLERLAQLYAVPYNTLIKSDDEEEPKNVKMTMEL